MGEAIKFNGERFSSRISISVRNTFENGSWDARRWDTGRFQRVFYVMVTSKWDAVAVAFYRVRTQIRSAFSRARNYSFSGNRITTNVFEIEMRAPYFCDLKYNCPFMILSSQNIF